MEAFWSKQESKFGIVRLNIMLQILDIIYEIVEKIKCFYAKGKKKKKKRFEAVLC